MFNEKDFPFISTMIFSWMNPLEYASIQFPFCAILCYSKQCWPKHPCMHLLVSMWNSLGRNLWCGCIHLTLHRQGSPEHRALCMGNSSKTPKAKAPQLSRAGTSGLLPPATLLPFGPINFFAERRWVDHQPDVIAPLLSCFSGHWE